MNQRTFKLTNLVLAVLLLILPVPGFAESKASYAVIISIDGLRPDAISKADVPNIKSLLTHGSYSLTARTITPNITLPAHISMLTGVTVQKHGMTLNFWDSSMGYVKVENIFEIAKKHGLKTAMFVGKDKLRYIAKPGSVDHFETTTESPTSVEDIAARFSSYFGKEKPQLTFIHFPEPDLTGHAIGWMTKDYLKAFERVDKAIGVALDTLRKAGVDDETFIVITADHGGKGKNHQTVEPLNYTIPWIAYGDGIKKDYKIKRQVYVYDTAPTALSALDIAPPAKWDGKPVSEIFENQ